MELTHMRAGISDRSHSAEMVIELDGIHYEAVRFRIGTDAVDLARDLHRLAERILHRASPPLPKEPA